MLLWFFFLVTLCRCCHCFVFCTILTSSMFSYQIHRVMGLLAFPPDTKCDQYAHFYSLDRWKDLITCFKDEYYELHGLTCLPLLEVALKVKSQYKPKKKNKSTRICLLCWWSLGESQNGEWIQTTITMLPCLFPSSVLVVFQPTCSISLPSFLSGPPLFFSSLLRWVCPR